MSLSVAVQGTGNNVHLAVRSGSSVCVFSLVHSSYRLVKFLDDFSADLLKAEGVLSSKAGTVSATNVSWKVGNTCQSVRQLSWENWCSSIKVSTPLASASEVMNMVRCPQGSDSLPIKSSYAVGKRENDVQPKSSTKVIVCGDLLTEAFRS